MAARSMKLAGKVSVPLAHEMVTLLMASRAYEANIAALQAARSIAEAGLNLAR